MCERNLDDFDAEERGIWILVGRQPDAPRELVRRAHAGRAGNVDVDIVRILGIVQHRVCVRAAAGLHVGDVFRIGDVGDVEDAEPAQPVVADGVFHTLRAAIESAAISLARDEEQVLVNRHIALRRRAEIRRLEGRRARVGDIPDLVTVVAALYRVRPREREVGVRDAGELFTRLRRRHEPQVPGCLGSVELSGAQTNPRIRGRLTG